jgi:hypothetical protein
MRSAEKDSERKSNSSLVSSFVILLKNTLLKRFKKRFLYIKASEE